MKVYTVRQLKALTTADAGTTLREAGGLVGLVRASKAGNVTVMFKFEYKRDGKKREHGCGTWPAVALANVRAERDAARALLNSGVDPIEARRAARLENQVAVETRIEEAQAVLDRATFETRFGEWERAALSKRKDGGAETRRAFEKDIFPAVGTKAIEDVKRADLMAVLDGIIARGANRLANRCLGDLKQFLTWCVDREIVAMNVLASITKKKVGGAEEESDRVLSEKELRALPFALKNANLKNTTQHAILLILATGVRVGEVIRARKAHVDMKAREWVIPSANSKNTDAHRVHLSDFAAHHMRCLLEFSDSEEWLLPARKRDGTESHVDLKSISKQIGDRQLKFFEREAHANRSVKFANALVLVPDAEESWSPHDLRRTAATMMQQLGVLPVVIDRVLNHREESKVRRTYARYDYAAEKSEAWGLLGERLELLLRPDASNVVTLPANAA
ncbi:tyrosine-type recombinase/integrase [Paraburkholderia sp. CNPSo 3155]|uniref:tyrosine-type recombinase/integrase n=1 Tax=Paraburkholderia atlantica TaxID=2654982 RepID=UPI00128CE0FC|nr:tyrosine-type recombinase/integrase [Paraburkholderia atlantica]